MSEGKSTSGAELNESQDSYYTTIQNSYYSYYELATIQQVAWSQQPKPLPPLVPTRIAYPFPPSILYTHFSFKIDFGSEYK